MERQRSREKGRPLITRNERIKGIVIWQFIFNSTEWGKPHESRLFLLSRTRSAGVANPVSMSCFLADYSLIGDPTGLNALSYYM